MEVLEEDEVVEGAGEAAEAEALPSEWFVDIE